MERKPRLICSQSWPPRIDPATELVKPACNLIRARRRSGIRRAHALDQQVCGALGFPIVKVLPHQQELHVVAGRNPISVSTLSSNHQFKLAAVRDFKLEPIEGRNRPPRRHIPVCKVSEVHLEIDMTSAAPLTKYPVLSPSAQRGIEIEAVRDCPSPRASCNPSFARRQG